MIMVLSILQTTKAKTVLISLLGLVFFQDFAKEWQVLSLQEQQNSSNPLAGMLLHCVPESLITVTSLQIYVLFVSLSYVRPETGFDLTCS